MNLEEMKLWKDGRDMYRAYINQTPDNRAIFPKVQDIKTLARLLDLTPKYVSKRVYFYLEN